MKFLKSFKEILLAIVIGVVISVTFSCFFRVSTVDGNSMNPTLEDKDILLVSTKSYKEEFPQRGDIVIIERKDLAVRYFIKRVIATENEKLTIKDNKVYINGELLEEDYLNGEMATKDIDVTIPKGYVFVMGDNRNNSLDSRSNILGFVDVETEVMGKTYKLF